MGLKEFFQILMGKFSEAADPFGLLISKGAESLTLKQLSALGTGTQIAILYINKVCYEYPTVSIWFCDSKIVVYDKSYKHAVGIAYRDLIPARDPRGSDVFDFNGVVLAFPSEISVKLKRQLGETGELCSEAPAPKAT
jgi:hypothetical protein